MEELMSKTELEKKMKAIEDRFNQLLQSRQELVMQIQQIDEEKLRLQGEYRLLDEMLQAEKEKNRETEPKKKIPKK
jgi:hypothetical protein